MLDLLADNPLLVLFAVVSAGWALGQVRIAGFSLGVAAVLFAGLAVGAVDDSLGLPSVIGGLGLVLFVYTVGLASGRGFLHAAIHRRGMGANLAAALLVALVAVLAELLGRLPGLDAGSATMAGTFAGAVTNTPALAAITASPLGQDAAAQAGGGATVGYALAYPLGVLVPLVATWWLLRGDRRARAAGRAGPEPMQHRLERATVRVTAADPGTLGDLAARLHQLVVSRVRRGDEPLIADPQLELHRGDLLVVVGEHHDVEAAVAMLGERSPLHPEYDRAVLTQRVVVVSSPDVAGRTLGELHLQRRYQAVASRVRRGDVEHAASDDLVLELGDRIKVVAPREHLPEVATRVGDSYRSLRHLDLLTLSLGLAVGLLLGAATVPLPGGGSLTLGAAGGPLVAGIVFGIIGRTGPLVWQLPHGTNLALRQLGAALFLAVVGTRAGSDFAETIVTPVGSTLLGIGLLLTVALTVGSVVLAQLVLRAEPRAAAGMLAALHTQPAVLAYAGEQSEDEEQVALGYALLLPVAMLTKIVAAQLLLR
jgi:putative transport protein